MLYARLKVFGATLFLSWLSASCSQEAIESTSSTKAVDGLRGEFEIQNWESNGVMDIEFQANHNGARVHMWGAINTWNQRWELVEVAPGRYNIKSQGGRCLDVSNGHDADDARIQVWDCEWGHPNQTFWIDRAQEYSGIVGYHLVNFRTNKPLAQYGERIGQQGGNREGSRILWKLNPK